MLGDDFIGGSAPLGIALAGRARASRAAQSLQQSGQRRTPRGVAPRQGAAPGRRARALAKTGGCRLPVVSFSFSRTESSR